MILNLNIYFIKQNIFVLFVIKNPRNFLYLDLGSKFYLI